jgi:hypothetical protein
VLVHDPATCAREVERLRPAGFNARWPFALAAFPRGVPSAVGLRIQVGGAFGSTLSETAGVCGDEHRGVALVFRPQTEDGRLIIPLVGANGTSSVVGQPTQYTRGAIKGVLEEVRYSDRPQEVDFFQSLGTLSRAKLERGWHVTPSGARSKLVDGMLTQHAEWREAYWEGFRRAATTKLLDWKHEQEYRFFLADILNLGDEPANRLVQYDLSSLVGIVFGLRTSEKRKLELMKAAVALCKSAGRSDVVFHQMAYSATQGRLLCV